MNLMNCAHCLALSLIAIGATAIQSKAAIVTVGSYQYDGSGLPSGDLGAAMTNPTNYSLFGVDSFANGGEVAFGFVTTAYLSGIDIFFTDRGAISNSPSVSDINNLVSFVNSGGVLIVNNDRSTTFTSLDPLLNAFGIDLVPLPTDSTEMLTIPLPMHPIMDGPFGQVTSMGLRDASRYAATSGEVVMLANWQNGNGAIALLGPSQDRLGAVSRTSRCGALSLRF